MSLHLGNLSSHVRGDELERVFRRFGPCNVQLKEGFGFVVYDFFPNAEKALRVLHGKKICGESITLSWSNIQPRPLQRFSRGNRSYQMQRGINSARGDHDSRKLGTNGRRHYKFGFKHLDSGGRRLNSADTVDAETSYHQDSIKEDIGEKTHILKEDLPEEGDIVQTNLVDDDRWGERIGVPSNDIEGGLEFDRYVPYHDDDDDRRDEDGNQQMAHSGDSPTLRKSQVRKGREQIGEEDFNRPSDLNYRQTCFNCGELGHKMRSCPREKAPLRKKFSKFGRSRDDEINFRDKGEGNVKRSGAKSHGGLRSGRDAVLMRQHKSDQKASGSRKHRRLSRSGNYEAEEDDRGEWRKDYLEKKRSRRDNVTPERHGKKARGPVSSPIHSDYTASRSLSNSKFSKSLSRSGSHSKSRSVSSKTRSESSRSRSVATSRYSGRDSSKSRARSRSSSRTSVSLSASLGQPLPSSPNKIEINRKGSLLNATFAESKEAVAEQAQMVGGDVGSDDSKLQCMTSPVETNNATASFKVDEDKEKDHSPQSNDDDNCAVSKVAHLTVESMSLQILGVMKDIHHSDVLVTEQMLAPTKRSDSEALIAENLTEPTKEPLAEASVRSRIANPASISSEELYLVLKHYGLEDPADTEKDLPVEAYLGAARMWPWEIIYYRRLRKGAISTENFSRRIAQNQEFGIVDKYIRSSSGWAEMGQENF